MSLKIKPTLLVSIAASAAMLAAVACGGAEETAAPAAPAAAATTAPAAQAQAPAAAATTAPAAPAAPAAQAADPTPTFTPPPEATIRPTNTPVAEYEARIAPTPVPSGPPQQGGTVRMSAYADTKDWDPLGSASLSSVISYSQLYNQLVHYNSVETDQVEGDLATDWQVSADGKTYTFNLHDNIQWNDGEPLTSADVAHSLLRYSNPCNAAGRSGLWRQYSVPIEVADRDGGDCTPTNADDVIRAVDDRTVEVDLRFPSGAFIKFMAVDYVKILPKHLLEQGVDLNLSENIIKHNSGSGPFVLESYSSGNSYMVNRNENYFKAGKPYFDRIEHFIIVDTATLTAQIEGRNIDMMNGGFSNLTPREYLDLEQRMEGEYVMHEFPPSGNWGFMMNVKREPFSDPRVRKAIHLAIDRDDLNEKIWDSTAGIACPLGGMGHSFDVCYDWPGIRPKDSPGGQEDLAEAKRLMAEAGYPDGFDTEYTARQAAGYPKQCQVIKQQLEETLGITGNIETLPSAAGYAKYGTSRSPDSAGDWEVSCQGEGMVVLDPDALYGGIYNKGGTRNYTDWTNPLVEEWFEAQKVEQNPDARREINKEAELWLIDFSDNHWVNLGWNRFFWIVHRDIKGFHPPTTVQYFFKYEDYWLDR
ncbi:MAG: ABC transporter substrate-binding protein [Chloroflexi bacterium]|nr:ABC transporter substrate-binding protein [Chloroflexota bacterium]